MSWRGYGYSGAELYHHGILGQKWGIRRYQNEDGSLTEEGKKRYHYGHEEVRKDNFLPSVDTYNRDTEKIVSRDLEKTISKTKEYNIAGAKAGLADAAGITISAVMGALVPAGAVGARIGAVVGISQARQNIYRDGKDKAVKALGYEDFADMYIKEYDKRAKNAGYPGLKETYKLLYGEETAKQVLEDKKYRLNDDVFL